MNVHLRATINIYLFVILNRCRTRENICDNLLFICHDSTQELRPPQLVRESPTLAAPPWGLDGLDAPLPGKRWCFLWLPWPRWLCECRNVDRPPPVNAYDFKCDFIDGGKGSCSMLYTVVRATIARQHNSCRLKTVNKICYINCKCLFWYLKTYFQVF